MKRRILAGLVIELLMFSMAGIAYATTQVISDDFNDNTLDPTWSIIMTQATGWSYTESGTTLKVTDIAATDSGWASVNLSQEFEPLSDFNIDFEFSWNSEGSDLAMQNVHVQVYTQEGDMIAYAGYSDGVFFEPGAQFGKAGGTIIDEGPDYPLPGLGSAIVNINRKGNDINVLWDGDLFISGTGDDLINRVDLVFSYCVYDDGELTSFFGNEAVDFINVEGTPTPDLIVEFGNTGHQYPPDPGADHQAEVELFITNIGEGSTEPKQVIDMAFFLVPIDSLEDEILVSTLQNISIGKLGKGRSKRVTLSVPLYIPPFTNGTFILGVYIDSSDNVEESNEENNAAITTDWYLTISEGTPVFLPDLEGEFLKVSFRDTKVRAEIAIINSGNVSTLRKQLIDIEICIRPCAAIDDSGDISIATFVNQSVSNLKPGNSKTLRFVFDMLAIPGYKLVAKIDSSDDVEELHEGNNEAISNTCLEPVKFVEVDYIESSKIYRISRFRSGIGHDYTEDFESCRSMKHYFQPKDSVNWGDIKIYSLVDGVVSRKFEEWAGTQVWIQSSIYPEYEFRIFHINLNPNIDVGSPVFAGQQLGTHIGSQTMSDIAVSLETPEGRKLVSYFNVMTDSLFQNYQLRGVNSIDELIISEAERDADPLTCIGEEFLNSGNLENWVILLD